MTWLSLESSSCCDVLQRHLPPESTSHALPPPSHTHTPSPFPLQGQRTNNNNNNNSVQTQPTSLPHRLSHLPQAHQVHQRRRRGRHNRRLPRRGKHRTSDAHCTARNHYATGWKSCHRLRHHHTSLPQHHHRARRHGGCVRVADTLGPTGVPGVASGAATGFAWRFTRVTADAVSADRPVGWLVAVIVMYP